MQSSFQFGCTMPVGVFRILKFQSPSSLFYQYRFSQRNYLTHIVLSPPTPSEHFIYRSSVLWNQLRKKLELEDISVSSSRTKAQLRSMLHLNQHKHDKLEWLSTHDFNINIISKSQSQCNRPLILQPVDWIMCVFFRIFEIPNIFL